VGGRKGVDGRVILKVGSRLGIRSAKDGKQWTPRNQKENKKRQTWGTLGSFPEMKPTSSFEPNTQKEEGKRTKCAKIKSSCPRQGKGGGKCKILKKITRPPQATLSIP